MPVTLRRFGLEQNRSHLEREKLIIGTRARLGGVLGTLLTKLDDQIIGFVVRLANRIYKNGRMNRKEWNSIRNRVLGAEILTPYHDFRNGVSKTMDRFQRMAFFEVTEALVDVFGMIYPVSHRTVSKKALEKDINDLEFMDSNLELDFLKKGREVVEESVYLEEMFRIREVLEARVGEVIEQKKSIKRKVISLFIGTGKINEDFEMFLAKQLTVGLAPADLITTVTTQHIADMQTVLLRNIRNGLDVGAARTEFMNKLSDDMLNGVSRKKMSFNTMRIMRTAHQRASTSATSLFALRNRDLIVALERVADGRPCPACVILDGTRWPVGSTISDHPLGMAHTDLTNMVIREKDGIVHRCFLQDLCVGDKILSGDEGLFVRVINLRKEKYSGVEYRFAFSTGTNVSVTPEHPFIDISGIEISAVDLFLESLEYDGNPSVMGIGGVSHIDSIKVRHRHGIQILHIEVEEPHTYICEDIILHNCIFVPITKTLAELGFDIEKVPENMRQAFEVQSRAFPTMYSRFFGLSEKDQRLVFGNNKLYDFWKAEKFPLQELVVKKNGMFFPTSFSEISARVEQLGGVSFPKAEIGFDFTRIKSKPDAIKNFMVNADPVDRAKEGWVMVSADDVPSELQFIDSEFVKGGNGFGNGSAERALLDPDVVARADNFIKFHPDGSVIPWWDINEHYRALGVYRRVGIDGKDYFAMPKSKYNELLKKKGKAAKKVVKKGAKKKELARAKFDFDEIFSDIDFKTIKREALDDLKEFGGVVDDPFAVKGRLKRFLFGNQSLLDELDRTFNSWLGKRKNGKKLIGLRKKIHADWSSSSSSNSALLLKQWASERGAGDIVFHNVFIDSNTNLIKDIKGRAVRAIERLSKNTGLTKKEIFDFLDLQKSYTDWQLKKFFPGRDSITIGRRFFFPFDSVSEDVLLKLFRGEAVEISQNPVSSWNLSNAFNREYRTKLDSGKVKSVKIKDGILKIDIKGLRQLEEQISGGGLSIIIEADVPIDSMFSTFFDDKLFGFGVGENEFIYIAQEKVKYRLIQVR